MQTRITFLVVFVLCSSACDSASYEAIQEVPEPELVSWEGIPQPLPEATYFLFGAGLKEGPRAALEQLLEEDIAIQDAYRPHTALCMALFLDQLVVVLEGPDERMQQQGFTTDPEGFAGALRAAPWSRTSA